MTMRCPEIDLIASSSTHLVDAIRRASNGNATGIRIFLIAALQYHDTDSISLIQNRIAAKEWDIIKSDFDARLDAWCLYFVQYEETGCRDGQKMKYLLLEEDDPYEYGLDDEIIAVHHCDPPESFLNLFCNQDTNDESEQ